MRAHARLEVALGPGRDGPGRTRVDRLRSDPPLVLRPTGPGALPRWGPGGPSAAHVSLAAGAAGPVGGDRLRLEVRVGAGAMLCLSAVAATLALPGPHGAPSRNDVAIEVAAGGTLVWLPGTLIAARGCHHDAVANVDLAPGARLLAREELVLGRHGERAGTVRQRLRVTLGGEPLHDQELAIGAQTPGWDGPVVTGGRRAVGSILVVDPGWDTPAAARRRIDPAGPDTAVLPLRGPAVVATALAHDALSLRRRLDSALDELGPG